VASLRARAWCARADEIPQLVQATVGDDSDGLCARWQCHERIAVHHHEVGELARLDGPGSSASALAGFTVAAFSASKVSCRHDVRHQFAVKVDALACRCRTMSPPAA